jgi:hypothetical protein
MAPMIIDPARTHSTNDIDKLLSETNIRLSALQICLNIRKDWCFGIKDCIPIIIVSEWSENCRFVALLFHCSFSLLMVTEIND